jgi:hypothetical protein
MSVNKLLGNYFVRSRVGRCSSVGVVTTLQAGHTRNLVSNPDRDERFFPIAKVSGPAVVFAQPYVGYRGSGRETAHGPLSGAVVKNE